MKTCTKCRQSLPKDRFYKDDRGTDGLRSWCKGCFADHKRQYRRQHREAARAVMSATDTEIYVARMILGASEHGHIPAANASYYNLWRHWVGNSVDIPDFRLPPNHPLRIQEAA